MSSGSGSGCSTLAPSADSFVWCGFIILNAHAPAEVKNGDTDGNFYKEVERVFGQFRKYCMKMLLRNFSESGKKDTCETTIAKENT
jgi:hypothetical protein